MLSATCCRDELLARPRFTEESSWLVPKSRRFAAIKIMSASDRFDLLDELWMSLDRDDFTPEMTSELRSLRN
jgi:hypothetical protein